MNFTKKQLALLSLLAMTGTIDAQSTKVIHPLKQKLYAETQSLQTSECQSFINLNKKYIYNGQGNNYATYMNQAGWEDADFPKGNNCFAWSAHTSGELPSSQYSTYTWQRCMTTTKLTNQSIFYQNTEFNDVAQGALGDCYFLSAIASVAEKPERFKQAILTDNINTGGVFAMTIHTRGLPHTYYVDDYSPFNKYNQPAFVKQANDGSLYPILIEKMWAKVNGNYEQTIGGGTDELFGFLAAVPVDSFDNTADPIKSNPDLISQYIQSAIDKGYVVAGGIPGCGTSDYNALGLVCGHAYSIHGTGTLNGVKLIKIRNPWSQDTYNGAYQDSKLTDADLVTLKHSRNANDGTFFVSQAEFQSSFYGFDIGYFINDDYNNYLDVTDHASGVLKTYTFTIPAAGDYSVGVEYYSPRMYPYGCKTQATTGLMKLKDPTGKSLTYKYVYEWNGMNAYRGTLSAGTYSIDLTPTWQAVDVKELTVRVVGPQKVTINGGTKTSQSRQLLHIDDSSSTGDSGSGGSSGGGTGGSSAGSSGGSSAGSSGSSSAGSSGGSSVVVPGSSVQPVDYCASAMKTDLDYWTNTYFAGSWQTTVYSSCQAKNIWKKNSLWYASPDECADESYYSYYYSIGKITGGASKATFWFGNSVNARFVTNTGSACIYDDYWEDWQCDCDFSKQNTCVFEQTTPNNGLSICYSAY